MSMDKRIEDVVMDEEKKAEVVPPRRVVFGATVKEVHLEVIEGPMLGRKRTRTTGPLVGVVRSKIQDEPTRPKKPRVVTQAEMWSRFGPLDRLMVEAERVTPEMFCWAYCQSSGCRSECPCVKDEVLCCSICPCTPQNCKNHDVARMMAKWKARQERRSKIIEANNQWSRIPVAVEDAPVAVVGAEMEDDAEEDEMNI
ncbi:unnamed protein product [Caenorhabditis bovis]|uniref:Uncharacterized protein n=1 Tax=Caenorhabditis bovis TaxID=2654633 RepID=A0A8S1EU64_9PELO|nr:unnamed protein product [Caenorhabditis bovis]